MVIQIKEAFFVIGISIRTTNENGNGSTDIPALWNRFFTDNISFLIPNKVNDSIICVYTAYESDYTKPYTTILGCIVKNLDIIPNGMIGIKIHEGLYSKFTAKGNLSDGIVFNEWNKIWNSDLNRKYATDYEVYGEKSQNMEEAEVDIFIGINS